MNDGQLSVLRSVESHDVAECDKKEGWENGVVWQLVIHLIRLEDADLSLRND